MARTAQLRLRKVADNRFIGSGSIRLYRFMKHFFADSTGLNEIPMRAAPRLSLLIVVDNQDTTKGHGTEPVPT